MSCYIDTINTIRMTTFIYMHQMHHDKMMRPMSGLENAFYILHEAEVIFHELINITLVHNILHLPKGQLRRPLV